MALWGCAVTTIILILAQSGNPVGAVVCLTCLSGSPYRQPGISLTPRCNESPWPVGLEVGMKGDRVICTVYLAIRSLAKPVRCVSCHGTLADEHAAHASRSVVLLEAVCGSTQSSLWFYSKQSVVLLEADCGSTRSRPWFYSKNDSPTVTPLWHHDAPEAGELSCGCLKANE